MRTKYRTGNNIPATNSTRMILVKQTVPHKQAAKEAHASRSAPLCGSCLRFGSSSRGTWKFRL